MEEGSASLFIICALPQPSAAQGVRAAERTRIEAQARRVKDADRHRCIAAFWRRRSCPHPAAQKTQVSSTCGALGPAAVISPSRRGQLRIRKRTTPASSSRNFVDSRARPAPVATPDRRRGLSQTNAQIKLSYYLASLKNLEFLASQKLSTLDLLFQLHKELILFLYNLHHTDKIL